MRGNFPILLFDTVSEKVFDVMSNQKKAAVPLHSMPQEGRYGYIAEAANDLFHENGYASVTMEKIAKRLGVGRTTLYDYFQSKDDILYFLIDQRIDLDEHIRLTGSIDARIQQLMVASLTRFKDNFVLYQILFTEKPAFAHQTTHKLLQWQQKVLASVKQLLSEAIDAGTLKPRCSATRMVFVFQALLGQRMSQLLLSPESVLETPTALQREAETLTNLMIRGIGELT